MSSLDQSLEHAENKQGQSMNKTIPENSFDRNYIEENINEGQILQKYEEFNQSQPNINQFATSNISQNLSISLSEASLDHIEQKYLKENQKENELKSQEKEEEKEEKEYQLKDKPSNISLEKKIIQYKNQTQEQDRSNKAKNKQESSSQCQIKENKRSMKILKRSFKNKPQ